MKKKKLDILYEDKDIIVVSKSVHLLTISTLKEKENTLYYQVSTYLKKQNKNNKVFIVHRLDKDTSGIVVFAKNIKAKNILQDNWANVKREYIALVRGNMPSKGIIKSYLKETTTNYVYSSKTGKEAITEYEKIRNNKLYSLLKINIKTGRKHQIRVQLNDLGYPIVGDRIYNKKDKEKRLCLHAYYIAFNHPITNKLIEITTPPPDFVNLVK